jgi:hypothetical protein
MKSFRHYTTELSEAAKRSLSRLHTHISAGHMVGFISASRANLSPSENNRRTKQLKKSLIQHGYAPIAVKGEYIEDHNGERRPVKEKSFMVHSGSLMAGHKESNPSSLHSEFMSDMKKHGEMYGQDTVLTVSQKHGSVFHGTGESTWVPKGKRSRIGGAGLKSGPEIEAGDFKSRLAGKPFIVGGETVAETVEKEGEQWVVKGKKGGESEKKVFGRHSSRKKAMRQLAAIEISKARRGQ